MKKNKKYYKSLYKDACDHIDYLREARRKADNLLEAESREIEALIKKYEDSKLTFTIRRVVTGDMATGKSVFLRKLLPRIGNYFLIDPCNEYHTSIVAPHRKLAKKSLSTDSTFPEKAEKAIVKNKDKVIVIDSFDMVFMPEQFIALASKHNLNFIIVTNRFPDKFIEAIDWVYDLDTTDYWGSKTWRDKTPEAYKEKEPFNGFPNELIVFAEEFAGNHIRSAGRYSSEFGNHKIFYDDNPDWTGMARVKQSTGEIQLSRTAILESRNVTPSVVFFLILWCYVRNRVNSDTEADFLAAQYYLSTGRSKKELLCGFIATIETRPCDANDRRYKLVEEMVKNHKVDGRK